MSQPKRHHYVPQFYLRKFADPGQPGVLWVRAAADRSSAWRRSSSKSVAYETGLYTRVGDDDVAHNELEHWMGVLESHTAPILDKIIQRQPLTAGDRVTFALFVGQLAIRGPVARDMMANRAQPLVQEMTSQLLDRLQSDEARLNEFYQSAANADQFASPKEYIEYLRSLRIELTPESAAGEAFRLWMPYVHHLLAMDWAIFYADSGQDDAYFITSDCPVCIHGPKPFEGDHGILQPDVQVSLPLSPTMAFYARWPESVPDESTCLDYIRIGSREVTVTNVRTAMCGRRFLLAHMPNLKSAKDAEAVWTTSRLVSAKV